MTLIEEWQALWPPLRLFITAGSSWLFFFLGSLLVDKASFCKCPAKGQEWIWKNRWISWLHAVIISVFTIYCLVICADGFIEDQMAMLTYQSHLMHFTLSFSVGYFIHDFVDNLVYTFNGSLEGIAVLAHHVVVRSSVSAHQAYYARSWLMKSVSWPRWTQHSRSANGDISVPSRADFRLRAHSRAAVTFAARSRTAGGRVAPGAASSFVDLRFHSPGQCSVVKAFDGAYSEQRTVFLGVGMIWCGVESM